MDKSDQPRVSIVSIHCSVTVARLINIIQLSQAPTHDMAKSQTVIREDAVMGIIGCQAPRYIFDA